MRQSKLKVLVVGFALLATMGLSTAALALEEGKLLIWYGGLGLKEVNERFTADTGVEASAEAPEDIPGKFAQAAAAGAGPDIVIWAHDRAGEFATSGLIDPVEPSQLVKDSIVDVGWEAFTINGRIWGYPLRLEAVGLIYNKDLVSEPPESFEEIFELDANLREQGKEAIRWDINNTYFTFPLMMANGGYVFAETGEGSYDVKDTGVNNEGSIKGAEMLVQLIEKGVIPKAAAYSDMEAGVNKGEIAMMLNGPWSWENLESAGIDFAVAPIPSVAGEPSKPFVGVVGAMINRASPNKDLAKLYLEEYMLTLEGLQSMDQILTIGTPTNKEFFEERSSDPKIQATMQNAELGVPMPSVPEMARFWSAMESALQNMTQGRQGAKDALDAAAQRIAGS
jgi:maltose/maltodextrin transport system substrate-binding protein